MNMDHMFIMRLAALLFGGGIAGTGHVTSGIFPETDSWQCRRQKAGLPVS